METERLSGKSYRLSAVRRDLENLYDKIDIVDTKVETLKLSLNPVSGASTDMDYQTGDRSKRIEELERRNELNSRKLQLLQKEVEHVQTENDILMQHLGKHELYNDTTQDDRNFITSRASSHSKHSNQDGGNNDRRWMPTTPNQPQPTPEYKQTEDVSRNIESSRKDMDQRSREGLPGERDNNDDKTPFDLEEYQRQRRAQKYSCYDSTAINPQCWTPKVKQRDNPWLDQVGDDHFYIRTLLFITAVFDMFVK